MKWQILSKETVFSGFLTVSRLRINHARFEGGDDMEVDRELIQRGHAAVVLPYDARRDEVVLVEQFRVGALESPHSPWLLEAIAGLIETGESALGVAQREACEEAGCVFDDLVHAFDYYPSPGSCDERCCLYIASVNSEGLGGHYGVSEEGEDIRVHVLPAAQAFTMMGDGVIESANAILALQWLQINRETLRQRWGADDESTLPPAW